MTNYPEGGSSEPLEPPLVMGLATSRETMHKAKCKQTDFAILSHQQQWS